MSDLRVRTGPVLALLAAIVALGSPALVDAGTWSQVIGVAGLVSGLLGVVFGIRVLTPGELTFAVDPVAFHAAAAEDRDRPEVYYLRLAETLREMQLENEPGVKEIREGYGALLGAVVLAALLLGVATAIG